MLDAQTSSSLVDKIRKSIPNEIDQASPAQSWKIEYDPRSTLINRKSTTKKIDLSHGKSRRSIMMDDEEDTRVNQMLSRKGTQVENFKKVVNLYTKPTPINTKGRGSSPKIKKDANLAYRRLSSDHNIM